MPKTALLSLPEAGGLVDRVRRLLSYVPVNGIITYDAISKAISRDARVGGTIHIARRALLADRGMVFEAVRGVGLKRCDDAGKIAAGRAHVRRARNQALTADVKTRAADVAALETGERRDRNTVLTQIAAILGMTSQETLDAIEARVSGKPDVGTPMVGHIKTVKVREGFAFISTKWQGKLFDVFMHRAAFSGASWSSDLVDMRVRFVYSDDGRGPRASNAAPLRSPVSEER